MEMASLNIARGSFHWARPGWFRYKLSDELVLHGITGGGAAGIDLELAVDRAEMGFDRVRTQDELLGNLAGT